MKQNPTNTIIAADDLYWNSIEKKYTVLSEDQIDKLLSIALSNGITNELDLCRLVEWATNARVGNLLFKYLMENKIKVTINENKEPAFAPKN